MIRLSFFLILLALACTGCQNHDARFRDGTQYLGGFNGRQREAGRAPHDDVSYWDGDGVSGPPSIQINLSEQRASFYKGDQLVGESIISTGREGFNTPSGHFKIQQKDKDHASSLYGDYIDARTGEIIKKEIDRSKDPMPKGAKFDGARMPYFMRIVSGVGMHEGFLPGYPASHGCIRMPGFMAQKFFDNISVGTPVTITP
jgi:lipoprotein-anchoring transpeptidase ErfK/SrfK